tara:strand:+ start:4501 stop:4863 length:363 start_codon:yes stop_codon:yes gene_type:complete
MANERLTDQDELTVKPAGDDWVYIVDKSDTTDNAAGSSFKMTVDNLLKGRSFKFIQGCLVFSFASDPSTTAIANTDWVIYMNIANTRIVIGIAKGALTTIPDDFDDGAKFAKFYDGNMLL